MDEKTAFTMLYAHILGGMNAAGHRPRNNVDDAFEHAKKAFEKVRNEFKSTSGRELATTEEATTQPARAPRESRPAVAKEETA